MILKVTALGPVYGYAIAQMLQQVSRDVVQVPQGSLYPGIWRCMGLKIEVFGQQVRGRPRQGGSQILSLDTERRSAA